MTLKSILSTIFGKGFASSIFQIKPNINSLNFDFPFPNAERLEKEEKLNLLGYYYGKWVLIILIGLSTGLIVLAVSVIIEELTLFKTDFMKNVLIINLTTGIPICVFFSIMCHIFSCIPVVFWHPVAQGVGVPDTRSYLNGVDIPQFEDWSTIPTRIISIVFMVFGGFPGGQTEALLPIGVIIACTLCKSRFGNYRFFPNHRYDGDRRDLGAVGLAAAASAAFGTPVGGAFFVLQQLSIWHGGSTFAIIIGSLLSSYTFIVIYNALRQIQRVYQNVNSLFSPFGEESPDYGLYEFPTFILMSLIGALIGWLWIAFHIQISRFRSRFSTVRYILLLEIIIVAVFISIAWSALFYSQTACTDIPTTTKFGTKLLNEMNDNFCSESQFSASYMFLVGNPETIMKTIHVIKDGGLSLTFTLAAFLVTFFTSAIHLGTATANGCIVPNLIMGALWGRLFKVIVADNLFRERVGSMAKYAYLGAVAQAAGVTQYSVAYGVMMVETVGIINFSIPVFLVIFCGRYFSQFLTMGIYDVLCLLKGYAVISPDPPPLCCNLTAKDVMSNRVVALPLSMTVTNVRNVLLKYEHLEFPVLESAEVVDAHSGTPLGVCQGLILRKQLITFLSAARKESIVLQLKEIQKYDTTSTTTIDVGKYMNVQPYFVIQDMPLTRLHALFESMSLHTVLVVNGSNQLIGLVTRKDFAIFIVKHRFYRSEIILRTTAEAKKA